MVMLKRVLILIIIIFSIEGCTSRLEKIQNYLNNNDYYDAVLGTNRIIKIEDRLKVIDMFKEKCDEIETQFLSGTIDGTRAIDSLQKFKDVDEMREIVSIKTQHINSLMNSQKAFLDGERAEKENNYVLAYESYYNVLSEDKVNYMKAQGKLVELEGVLKKNSPIEIEMADIIKSNIEKQSNKGQIQVVFVNKSNYIINSFTISVLGFDENGNLTEIKGIYNSVENYEFLGSSENLNIKPGEAWGKKYAWSFSSNSKLKTILACMKDITFEDGTVWKNPLYISWIDKNRQKI